MPRERRVPCETYTLPRLLLTIDTRQATDARQTTAPRFEASVVGVKQSPEEQVRHTARMPVPDDVDPAMLAWATRTFGLIKTGSGLPAWPGRIDATDTTPRGAACRTCIAPEGVFEIRLHPANRQDAVEPHVWTVQQLVAAG